MKCLRFSAKWCGPCQGLKMIVNGAKDKLPIEVEEVDIDDNIMMAQQFNVRSVPTLVIVDEQENELKRHVGLLNEETLLEFLKG